MLDGTGSNNTVLGYQAGWNVTSGSNNVEIANQGKLGDSNTMRIGTQGTQTAAYMAGIFGSAVMGDVVMVTSAGQLGTGMSSARYKRDIHHMSAASDNLMKLRPVTFRYKQDPKGQLQYGLIAEEVAKIYPELVIYGEDGKVQTVRYLELIPMLLNELQKQATQNQRQSAQIRQLTAQVQELKGRFEAMTEHGGSATAAAFIQ